MQLLTSKSGVAIVASNDYGNNTVGLFKLDGAHKDAAKMLETFTELQYSVYHCENMTTNKLTDIIIEIAALLMYASCANLVFAFSGYGTTCSDRKDSEISHIQLYTQEGETVGTETILDTFTSFQHPKLFFFDLCQNSLLEPGWLMPKKLLSLDFSPKKDNILIACSASPYKELNSGSLWIEILTNELLAQNKDVEVILDDVSKRLNELHDSLPLYEAPQFVNMLKRPVNFLAESFSGNL